LPTSFEIVGKTIDDAAGEAFDKVARILNLPYPGGPEISRLANKHRADFPNYQSQYDLPFPMQHSGDFNFSFSGLKTAAKYLIEKNNLDDPEFVASFAREFEETVVKILVTKFEKAITEYRPQQLLVGGGVSANQYLRSELERLSKSTNIDLLISPTELCGDNALMIAMSGFWQSIANNFTDPIDITAQSGWKISE